MKKQSANRAVVKFVNKLYDRVLSYAISFLLARKELGKIIDKTGIKCSPSEGENEWKIKWERLTKRVNVKYYRVFSQYLGGDINIVPDDICHNIIENILNPQRYKGCLDDKNLFDVFLSTVFLRPVTPETYIRCVDGVCMGGNYRKIDDWIALISNINSDRLIAKPTYDSSSGNNVCLFSRNGGGYFVELNTGLPLSADTLNNLLGDNYILQRCIQQSFFMRQFCTTAVNTIRVATYRSVRTNKVEVINSIMRIGSEGAYIDNAHAGGCFIGVYKDGHLGKYLCNQYGQKFSQFNNIDFSNNDFVIPEIEKVWEFSKKVAECIPHMRLLQLDVAINQDGQPLLIEYNIRGFSPWLYQFTTGSAFGEYTSEIAEYCEEHIDEATRITVSF